MRKLTTILLSALFLVVLFYGYLLWQNNRALPMPDQARMQTAYQQAVTWMETNQDDVLATFNPMLWYMIRQAAAITGDSRLQALFTQYHQRYFDTRQENIWRPLFYPDSWVSLRFEDIQSLPYYNWHFLYAITCDHELARVEEISAQNDPQFCNRHPLRPACVTHQLMGIRLLQRKSCGDAEQLAATVQTLQARIRRQLALDPRVVDVYLQRVLMLLESGAGELVKPVWIEQILKAQLPDGGWGPAQALVPLGSQRYLAFSGKGISVERNRSSFHATAQGILIFSLLLQENRQGL